MRLESVQTRRAGRIAGGAAAFFLIPFGAAFAFPLVDISNQSSLPAGLGGGLPALAPLGSDLAPADSSGLRGQLKLANPAAGSGGWVFTPRIGLQELFTDNAFEVKSPRKADAVTVLAPGINIAANTARVQLQFDYQPNLMLHAINGSLNAITQQLNATGTITVVPDLAFVDVRGVTGVQSRLGGLAGTGSLGSSAADISTSNIAQSPTGSLGQGLTRQNEVQTSSFGISPYLLRRFGDYGTAKLGVSGDISSSNPLTGFASSPFPTGSSANGVILTTTEQIAQFTSGESLGAVQDTLSANLSQSTSRYGAGTGGTAGLTTTSHREIFNNQISYALNRTFTILASVGHEHIQYSQAGFKTIDDITWSGGATITPNPDSSLTLTYGRQNGFGALNASGHYQLSARSLVSVSYTNSIGSQLENVQNQLNQAVSCQAGCTLVNGQLYGPNGTPLFAGSNALGVQSGLFRFSTLTASWQTTLNRDTLSASVAWSNQSTLSGNNGFSSQVKTVSAAWVHALQPDLTFSTGASYSVIQRSGATGSDNSVSAAAALQYSLSPSTKATARYSFYDRVSGIPGYSMYENMLLLGITKQF